MKPLLVLGLVLAAVAALLFAVFAIDRKPAAPPKITPTAVEQPPANVQSPVELVGTEGNGTRTDPGIDQRTAAGDPGAVVLDNRLTGLVKNPMGAPVVGAEVILTTLGAAEIFFVNDVLPDMTREPRARTDQEGRYTFAGVQPRKRYTLVLSHPEYATKEEPTVPIGESGLAEMPPITMSPGATLTGRVRNEPGDAIAGATMHLEGVNYMGVGQEAPDRVTVVSDAGGGYEFKNVARGPRYMIVSAPGYATMMLQNLHFEGEENVVRDVTLKVAEAICGRVVGPENVGIPGAKVLAVGLSATQQTTRAQVETDANGEFCFEDLAPGPYNLIAAARGFRSLARNNRVETNTANHVIEMAKEATIAGRVIEKGSGKPIAGFQTRLRAYNGPGAATAPIEEGGALSHQHANGEFLIDAVPPGELVVEAWAPGYAPGFSAPVTVQLSAPITGIVVQLGKGGSISGRVVDAQGKPIARAKVTSRDKDWADDAFTEALGGTYPTNATFVEARTDDAGRFVLKNLNPERYMVQVEATGFTSTAIREIDVPDGGDSAIGDVRLGRGGTVRGTVFDAAGRPLSGAIVSVRIVSGDVAREYTTRSGGDGRYELGTVAPGRYVISAFPSGPADGNPFAEIAHQDDTSMHVVVDEGQTTTQDLNLTQ